MQNKGIYFQIDELDGYGLRAIYTTKDYGNVMEIPAEKFIRDLEFNGYKVVAGHQTHSSNIAVIDDETDKFYFENTDGFITDRRDVVIFTKYADCLPIYMYDRKKEIMGLVHSGWQGTYSGIGIKAVDIMIERFGSDIRDIVTAFGIGISAECYEVGEEFLEKFALKFDEDLIAGSFIRKDGKIFFDNQKFNLLNFLKKGLRRENIITNNLCTYTGNFHSYRRDREKSGRNGAFICFKKEDSVGKGIL